MWYPGYRIKNGWNVVEPPARVRVCVRVCVSVYPYMFESRCRWQEFPEVPAVYHALLEISKVVRWGLDVAMFLRSEPGLLPWQQLSKKLSLHYQ